MFSLVTGYVVPRNQSDNAEPEIQRPHSPPIAKSAFRRVPRLLLPIALATTIIWLFCQFGVFEMRNRIESWWVNYTSPNMTPYFGDAVKSLI
jgi:hypothetical protein